LYGRVGQAFVILAIGPEAMVDAQRFKRMVAGAGERLAAIVPDRTSPTQQAQSQRGRKER